MKPSTSLILNLLATSASAQLLHKGIGNLPGCAYKCPALTAAQSSCNGKHSTALSVWECFCPAVYTAANENIGAICPSTCTSATEEAQVQNWFSANCGNDNGVREHSGSGGSSTGSGSSASGSAAASSGSSGSSSGGGGSWWSGHWQWIVMVIILAIGLVAIGFGARWWKKRHDRKRDEIRGGFNSGITSQTAQYDNDKLAPPSSSGGAAFGASRESPARSRDAFMPYGYGYSRSESSRLNDSRSELPRGTTPVNDVEKAEGEGSRLGGAKEKLKRVLVRERSSR